MYQFLRYTSDNMKNYYTCTETFKYTLYLYYRLIKIKSFFLFLRKMIIQYTMIRFLANFTRIIYMKKTVRNYPFYNDTSTSAILYTNSNCQMPQET